MTDKEQIRQALSSFMTNEQIDEYFIREEKRGKNLRQGDNVIDVVYSETIISEQELLEVRNELQAVGFDISFYTYDGVTFASAAPPDPTIASIAYDLAMDIIFKPAATAILAKLGLLMWERCTKKTVYRVTSAEAVPYRPETAIFIKVSKTKAIKYTLPNDLPRKVVEKAINNILIDTKSHYEKDMTYYRLQRNGRWKPTKPFKLSAKKAKKAKKEIKGIIKFDRNKSDNNQ